MSITKEQQQALDDALVPREQHLRIGNCNFKLSITFKPKEPTFHVALDVLSLTPFYQAFLISASVHAIYMHEFWATKFVDPSFEEEILAFIKNLGYSGNMKSLFNDKVETLSQPWRTFGTIINKCGLGIHEGTGVILGVPNVPTYGFDDERISWKSNDDEDDNNHDDDNADDEDNDGQDDDNEQTELDNDGDDFVHPKFHTPSHFESTDDEAYDEVT
nr:hypothetical protein [Tanacetum cinerariifolium]